MHDFGSEKGGNMKLKSLLLSLVAVGSMALLPQSAASAATTTFSCTAATVSTPDVGATPTVSTCSATAADGSLEEVQIPSNFNGNLILYSHGYVFDGSKLSAADAFSPQVASILLAEGDALAGSSYAVDGWGEVKSALTDQMNTLADAKALLAANDAAVLGQKLSANTVNAVYATGVSLGGMITAALVQQNPTAFSGALPACGVVGGGVSTWNQALYAELAFKTFFDPTNSVAATGISLANSTANYTQADTLLGGALQKTSTDPATAARLALVAALGNVPTWFSAQTNPALIKDGFPVQSAATAPDVSTASGLQSALLGQVDWLALVDFPYAFGPGRADLEAVAGGNPSWTNGVNYAYTLSRSQDYAEVLALYKAAGISLASDLAKLQSAPQVSANVSAVHYLQQYFSYNGNIQIPVLTMHTVADGLVTPQNETLYASAVGAAGNSGLLDQVYVNQPGHCAFSAAEYVSALHALMSRVSTGSWTAASPSALNSYAAIHYPNATYNATTDTAGNVYAAPPAFNTSGYSPGPALAPSASGYVMAGKDGGTFTFNSIFRGSMGGKRLNAPVVGIARTPGGQGYWLAAADGGVFSFGSATFYGSMGGKTLNAPVVGIAATPDGKGYWLVGADGGVFSFGDANYYGSMGGKTLNAPVVGVAAAPNGQGYWLAAADGGVFSFGSAKFQGSMGGKTLNAPVVGIKSYDPTGGYTLVASDGGVFNFNSAFDGSMGGKTLNAPIVGAS